MPSGGFYSNSVPRELTTVFRAATEADRKKQGRAISSPCLLFETILKNCFRFKPNFYFTFTWLPSSCTSQAAVTFLGVKNSLQIILPHQKNLLTQFLIKIGKKSKLYRCCELITERTLTLFFSNIGRRDCKSIIKQ